jgi:membrane protein
VADHEDFIPDDATWPGHDARSALHIPLAGWKQIVARVWRSIGDDDVSLMAAGLAFYGMFAVVPALIAAITLYGLVSDPQQVQALVDVVTEQVSGGVAQVLHDQLTQIVSTSDRTLSLGLAISLAAALWSASAGIGNLLRAVNLAYDEVETRSYVRRRAMALAFTSGGILFILTAVALIAILPAVLGLVGLRENAAGLVTRLRWPFLLVCGMSTLIVIYTVAPNRRAPRLPWVTWGSAVALLIWIAGSWGFSAYVENFASYNETYGSLGGVVVLLMWFYLTAFAILLGAEINAEIELQTGVDTTVGPPKPRGQRGAMAADHTPLDDPRRRDKRPARRLKAPSAGTRGTPTPPPATNPAGPARRPSARARGRNPWPRDDA